MSEIIKPEIPVWKRPAVILAAAGLAIGAFAAGRASGETSNSTEASTSSEFSDEATILNKKIANKTEALWNKASKIYQDILDGDAKYQVDTYKVTNNLDDTSQTKIVIGLVPKDNITNPRVYLEFFINSDEKKPAPKELPTLQHIVGVMAVDSIVTPGNLTEDYNNPEVVKIIKIDGNVHYQSTLPHSAYDKHAVSAYTIDLERLAQLAQTLDTEKL